MDKVKITASAESGLGLPNPVQSVLVESPADVNSLVELFEDIAASEGWQPGDGLRHTAHSVYFGLRTCGGRIEPSETEFVGGLQLVGPDDSGNLPCQKIWPESFVNGDESGDPSPEDGGNRLNSAHVTVLAVRREWRGRRGGLGASCFWVLTVALWHHCIENGIAYLWVETTPTMLRCYRLLGWPLKVRGQLRSHWGEDCYLCSLSLRETAGALVEKALRSRTYRRIIETALDAEHDMMEKGTLP